MSPRAARRLKDMSTRTPRETVNLAELYEEPLMDWSRAAEALPDGSQTPETACFLGTVRPDGRPHAAGIGIAHHEGDLYFTSSPDARKAKNLAANPACTVSLRLEGIDLAVEGTAERVTDPATLATIAALYREGGWPAQVDEEAAALTADYSAQSAGPPPWHLYRMTIDTVFGVATRPPSGASRWRF
jgi:pyridoxine/pyridoxamine 5'-phosphate oxidase